MRWSRKTVWWRTLKTRWETELAALANAEQLVEAARHQLPPLPGRAELEQLAEPTAAYDATVQIGGQAVNLALR